MRNMGLCHLRRWAPVPGGRAKVKVALRCPLTVFHPSKTSDISRYKPQVEIEAVKEVAVKEMAVIGLIVSRCKCPGNQPGGCLARGTHRGKGSTRERSHCER